MLEPILKGLVEWIYQMMVDIMAYASGELLGVMSMDLAYFEQTAPIISEIVSIFTALGWALLIGNLVFQLLKAVMSGAGFEAEDPKILFLRTFVFAFLLLASRQICEIGLSITSKVIDLLQLPTSITVQALDESMFSLGAEAKWLLVIIVGVVLMVQMVKLLFEIGERYVITSVLTYFAPLAFSMGGSRNTNDIFKGWCRMYGSMLVMMIMNIVFLKLIMSAMSRMTSGGVLIWLVFVVALTRVARKIDSHIGKIGLNPAQTGSGVGSRIPGMMTMMAVRVMTSTISRSLAGAKGASGRSGTSARNHRSAGGTRFNGFHAGTGRNGSTAPGSNAAGAAGAAYANANSGQSNSGNVNAVLQGGSVNSRNTNGCVVNSRIASSTNTDTQNTGAPQTARAHTFHQAPGGKEENNSAQSVTSNQNTQSGATVNPQAGGNVAKRNGMARPPIPRNPAISRNPTISRDSALPKNPTDIPAQDGTIRSIEKEHTDVSGTGRLMQSVSRANRQNVNSPIANSESVQKHTEQIGGRNDGGIVNGGTNAETQLGGTGDRISVGGNMQRVSGSQSQFSDNSSEYFTEKHDSRFTQTQGRTEVTERRINHEYKHGKYNPAAANKKERQTYYQKDFKKENHSYYQDRQYQRDSLKRERGEERGKRKRKK